MPEVALDGTWVGATGDEEAGTGVPQAVRREPVVTQKKKLHWADLVAAEPWLLDMERDAWAAWRSGRKALDAWYTDTLRYRLPHLVGDERPGHPILGTEEAYNVAYDHLLAILERPRPQREEAAQQLARLVSGVDAEIPQNGGGRGPAHWAANSIPNQRGVGS